MSPHQERVVAERAELHEKITKLHQFMDGDVFAGLQLLDQNLLRRQLGWMSGYEYALDDRIRRFT